MEITQDVVTDEDWREIVIKAVSLARKGDAVSRKWLSDYLLGLPIQKIAPVTPDGENPYLGAETSELIDLARKITHAEDTGE